MRENWCCADRIYTFPGQPNPVCCRHDRQPGWPRSLCASRTVSWRWDGSPSAVSMPHSRRWRPVHCRHPERRDSVAYPGNFTARLTAAGADGAAGLNATLDGQGKANGLGASVTGQLAADGTLAGTIAQPRPQPCGIAAGASGTVSRGRAADGRQRLGGNRRSRTRNRRVAGARGDRAARGAGAETRHRVIRQPSGSGRLAARAAACRHHDRRGRGSDRVRTSQQRPHHWVAGSSNTYGPRSASSVKTS